MAIYGIGTDIVQVSRIAAVLERTNGRFAEKVLGPDELRVFHARRARSEARGIAFLSKRHGRFCAECIGKRYPCWLWTGLAGSRRSKDGRGIKPERRCRPAEFGG